MLNFSRLSRRTQRMVKALISCQYSFMMVLGLGSFLDLFDAPAGVRKEHIVEPRAVVLDEFDAAPQAVRRLQNDRQRLLGRLDPNIEAFERRPHRLDRGLRLERGLQ